MKKDFIELNTDEMMSCNGGTLKEFLEWLGIVGVVEELYKGFCKGYDEGNNYGN